MNSLRPSLTLFAVVTTLIFNGHAIHAADPASPGTPAKPANPNSSAATTTTRTNSTRSTGLARPKRSLDTNALNRMELTLKQQKQSLGADHPVTLGSMLDLAVAYLAAGRLADALPLAEETVQLSKTKLQTQHPQTLSAAYTLAEIQIAAKNYTNAESIARQVLSWTRKTYVTNSWAIGDSLMILSESLLRQGKFVEAEPSLREGLPIMEKHQANLSPAFTAQGFLGWSLLEQKKFAEAEPLLVKSYDGLKQRDAQRPSPTRAPLLKEAGERIVRLYQAWDKPEQAAAWKKKLAQPNQPTPTATPRT